MSRKILLALLCCSVGLSGCERLSEKDKMDMIAKCDTEARKKIKERSEEGRYPRGGNWYSDTTVTTHYSFSEKRCFALEETDYRDDTYHKGRALYDGLTKKMLIRTDHKGKSARSEEWNMTSDNTGLIFKSDTDVGRLAEADSEIDRLMNLP